MHTGDVNTHSYSDTHTLMITLTVTSNIINSSDHITPDTDTLTRVTNTTYHHASSPDSTVVSSTLYNNTTWSSEHSPR